MRISGGRKWASSHRPGELWRRHVRAATLEPAKWAFPRIRLAKFGTDSFPANCRLLFCFAASVKFAAGRAESF